MMENTEEVDKKCLSATEDQAFLILDVLEIDSQQLVKIKTLWGSRPEALCRWGTESLEWTPRYKRLLNFDETDDGKIIVTILIMLFQSSCEFHFDDPLPSL